MIYDELSNKFRVVLIDNLDDPLPKNTLEIENAEGEKGVLEVADKLKKLKELVDMEAIMDEEFKKEKKN